METKSIIKKILKETIKPFYHILIPQRWRKYIEVVRRSYSRQKNFKALIRIFSLIDRNPSDLKSVKTYNYILKNLHPLYYKDFVYTFDPNYKRYFDTSTYSPLTSVTPDYGYVVSINLNDIKTKVKSSQDILFSERINSIINDIEKLAHRIATDNNNFKFLPELINRDAHSMYEALQKILFYNGLLWQSGHVHNGIGRLDLILEKYYKQDLEKGILTNDKAKQMLIDFVMVLNKHTKEKSPGLIGDTGQYILLGGIDETGDLVNNEITKLFLEVFTELNIPDPKLILRVNEHTTDETMDLAMKCVATGCGSPLFMNEKKIMDDMVAFDMINQMYGMLEPQLVGNLSL